MSRKKKLKNRFLSLPSDFTFDELVTLFGYFGYRLNNKGKTSGSRVSFVNGLETYYTHRPHPGNVVKKAALIDVYEYLVSMKIWEI
ncbi:MAG: type II toxin-antitoxin system HicA family toxin [Bacteroidales bacterium]|nr:type II toxin-antitoxin system HicA family toxin [Bacteroidales bacterium]